MVIEVRCTTCRQTVATADKWSRAVTLGAVHEHQPVRVIGVISRAEAARLSRDYYGTTDGSVHSGRRTMLHLDSDGSTILIPVLVGAAP